MFDDLFEALFEEVDLGLKSSRRAQVIGRMFFGVLGLVLSAAGVWHMLSRAEGGLHLRVGMAAMFSMLGAFFLFDVCLLKAWRWPWVMLLLSFGMLFVLRIVFGP